jgi:hypothetical protein
LIWFIEYKKVYITLKNEILMALQVWFEAAIRDELQRQTKVGKVAKYGCSGEGDILTGAISNEGAMSHLGDYFTLGKVRFWKSKDAREMDINVSIPFVLVRNHFCYPNGLALSPVDRINVRYHNVLKTIGETEEMGRHTIDETTPLHRVQLVHAPNEDFMGRVFATWHNGVLIPKTIPRDSKLLVYCHQKYLSRLEGR